MLLDALPVVSCGDVLNCVRYNDNWSEMYESEKALFSGADSVHSRVRGKAENARLVLVT